MALPQLGHVRVSVFSFAMRSRFYVDCLKLTHGHRMYLLVDLCNPLCCR